MPAHLDTHGDLNLLTWVGTMASLGEQNTHRISDAEGRHCR
ncbi:hypothetical protein LI90_4288 [Carbonactinospora thermoautotrophica]|uniref:Uncharacterized protein n=1 Tax=Carbonactinospora thermoautotrophica TaxID=1469144 RepID=A0A132MZK1_9ACTN|nr:hypothetical protein LI90_4288 [Carbonactinospora thermoautotrophica]